VCRHIKDTRDLCVLCSKRTLFCVCSHSSSTVRALSSLFQECLAKSLWQKRPACRDFLGKIPVCTGFFWKTDLDVLGSFGEEVCVCRPVLEEIPVCAVFFWKRDLYVWGSFGKEICVFRAPLGKRLVCS